MKLPEQGHQIRVFIDEDNSYKGKPLYEAIVLKARELNLAGATVTKGIMGFGSDSRISTAKILRLSSHMPIVIEIVDTPDNIEKILPFLDEVVDKGLVTLENINIKVYR